MRKVIAVLIALILLQALNFFGQSITVLSKGEVYTSENESMIVMDKYTFGKYHYTAEKFDTLKRELEGMDSLLQVKDAEQDKIASDYEAALKEKDKEAEVLKDGFSEMKSSLQTSIDENDKLQMEYKKLEAKHSRAKRWRNFFMGTSAVTVGIIVLLVAH